MMCAHCMEDARPCGQMMSFQTFQRAVSFGKKIGVRCFIISGGEPTENEKMYEMLMWFDNTMRGKAVFAITSNGMWLRDEKQRKMVEKIIRLRTYLSMQVYTNKQWYSEYDYVMEHRAEYERYRGVKVDTELIYMQDLGRAKYSDEAQREVEKNHYNMSCLNATLAARQVKRSDFALRLEERGQLCKPSIDVFGEVHMSECSLCPSVGSVMVLPEDTIWRQMQNFKPCLGCKNAKRFLVSKDPKISLARSIIFS